MPLSEEHANALSILSNYPSLLHQEDTLSRTPFDVSGWLVYLDEIDSLLYDTKAVEPRKQLIQLRDLVGRRSVQQLPGSYKLWKLHWEFLVQHGRPSVVMAAMEQALLTLHKSPRLWLDYLHYVYQKTHNVTEWRRLANRALVALPVTQHSKLWPLLLRYWANTNTNLPLETRYQTAKPLVQHWKIPQETQLRILRRYATLDPNYRVEYAQACVDAQKWGEAARVYQQVLNDTTSQQRRHDVWMAFAKVCTEHALQVERDAGISWQAIVRARLLQHKEEELQGVLWTQLADSWIRQGEFDLARSVYEEALETVNRVRDFSVIFDAYIQFEEGLLEATMELQDDQEDDDEQQQNDKQDDWDLLVATDTPSNHMADVELALERAEHITARRPRLLNRVLLRQNPHNVGEWLKRCQLYQQAQQPELAVAALEEALQTVDARQAMNGLPSQLVIALATTYEESGNLEKARTLLGQVCWEGKYKFVKVDDLAACVVAWTDLELRHEEWDEALKIARRAVAPPQPGTPKLVRSLSRTLRVWDVLLDLEESLGTIQTAKDAYHRALDLKVATPMHVLNFASFLTDHKYFEESFNAYERGIELFAFPHAGAKLLWKTYLDAFIKRYKGIKVERVRDLFQRCHEGCPAEDCSEFYMMNGEFEEEYGLTKRALNVYRAMCQKVPATEKYTAYQLFVAKTTKYLGVTATRDIYQEAIEALQDLPAAKMCLEFAKMETSLQEIERARAVLTYGAQMADPRRLPEYYKDWNEFEISHGNEESFREMLRVKRGVEAAFSATNYNAVDMSSSDKIRNLTDEEAMNMIAAQEGVELEKSNVTGFVKEKRSAEVAGLGDVEQRVAKLRKATGAELPAKEIAEDDAEIDLDDLEDEDEDENTPAGSSAKNVKDVSTKSIPAAVFGGLANQQS